MNPAEITARRINTAGPLRTDPMRPVRRRRHRIGSLIVASLLAATGLAMASGENVHAATCSDSWTGGGVNSLWTNPANWTAGVPDATKDVCIGDITAGTYSVTMDSQTGVARSVTIGGASGTQTLIIGNQFGSLTISNPSAVGVHGVLNLDLSYNNANSILTGSTLTNNGMFRVTGIAGAGAPYVRSNVINNGALQFQAPGIVIDSGVTITNNATTTVAANASVIVRDGATFVNQSGTLTNAGAFNVRTFNSAGTFTQGGGTVTGNDPVIENAKWNGTGGGAGTFTVVGASTLTGGIAVPQTLRIDDTSGSGIVGIPTAFTNAGTLIVDMNYNNANTILQPTAGVATLTNTGTLRVAGVLLSSGSRSIRVDVVNSGRFVLDANAVLDFTGAFTHQAGGTTEFDLASASVFGRMVARNAGSVTLGGTATPVLVGGYSPPPGSTFDVITAPHSGDFATVTNTFGSDVTNAAFVRLVSGVNSGGVAPTITSADNTTFTVGTAGSFITTAIGTPTPTLSATGALPGGVSFLNGVLSGTPPAGTAGVYLLTIRATNGIDPDATQAFTLTVVSTSAAVDAVNALVPARLLDTRLDGTTFDGVGQGSGVQGAGATVEVQVTGRSGVPVEAEAAILNVTVTDARAAGFVTVWPCGSGRPNASSLNYIAGSTVPNGVIAKIGTNGKVCLYVSNPTHLLVDIAGFFAAGAPYVPLVPARVLDTRTNGSTFDGESQGAGLQALGSVTEVQVSGRAGVPADASAVALNVTVTEARGAGFVTVYPCGTARPNASNLNYVTGSTVPNNVIAKIGAGGKVCIYVSNATHLLADVSGYFRPTTSFQAIVPNRLTDTRADGATIDGVGLGAGLAAPGSVTEVQVNGRAGVPADATAVVLNVTATEAQGAGFVTVWPCGTARPNASNLNYVAGSTVPNGVLAKLGADGKVCLFASNGTHLITDVAGYFTS